MSEEDFNTIKNNNTVESFNISLLQREKIHSNTNCVVIYCSVIIIKYVYKESFAVNQQ